MRNIRNAVAIAAVLAIPAAAVAQVPDRGTFYVKLRLQDIAHEKSTGKKVIDETNTYERVISFRDGKILFAVDEIKGGAKDFVGTTHTGAGRQCLRQDNVEYCVTLKREGQALAVLHRMSIGKDVYAAETSFRLEFAAGGCQVSKGGYHLLHKSPIWNNSGKFVSASCRKG